MWMRPGGVGLLFQEDGDTASEELSWPGGRQDAGGEQARQEARVGGSSEVRRQSTEV